MVPPLQQAGLYKGLRLLKDSIDSYRQRPSAELLEDIRLQAEKLGLQPASNGGPLAPAAQPAGASPWAGDAYIAALGHELILLEQRMIRFDLHMSPGQTPGAAELADVLALVAAFYRPALGGAATPAPLPQLAARALGWDYEAIRAELKTNPAAQQRWERIDTIVETNIALAGRGVLPHAASGRAQRPICRRRSTPKPRPICSARPACIPARCDHCGPTCTTC
ncbi:MAG: cobaltochelatase subunit CobN [Kouleothrix sp.]